MDFGKRKRLWREIPCFLPLSDAFFGQGGTPPLDPPERASFVLLNAEIFTMSSDLQKTRFFEDRSICMKFLGSCIYIKNMAASHRSQHRARCGARRQLNLFDTKTTSCHGKSYGLQQPAHPKHTARLAHPGQSGHTKHTKRPEHTAHTKHHEWSTRCARSARSARCTRYPRSARSTRTT